MTKSLDFEKNSGKALKDFLHHLLKNDHIDGIFAFRKDNLDYGLATNTKELAKMDPLYPLMPANAGQLLGRFTPMDETIAAVIHPCEFRAFIEIVKREQGVLDNFLLITHVCGGVFPLKTEINDEIDEVKYWESVNNAELPAHIRPTCNACELIVPTNSDILINSVKSKQGGCEFYFNTEKGEEYGKKYSDKIVESRFDEAGLKTLLKRKTKEKEKLFSSVKETGLDGLVDIFGKCVGCHGCNSVCPICYCSLCDFDSANYDYNTPILEKELKEKGALRLPPDTIFFHLGRLSHMSFSCVGCGQCSDVCPADISVAAVFKKVGEETAGMFDFVAGRDVNEEIPVMVYKEEEFPQLGK